MLAACHELRSYFVCLIICYYCSDSCVLVPVCLCDAITPGLLREGTRYNAHTIRLPSGAHTCVWLSPATPPARPFVTTLFPSTEWFIVILMPEIPAQNNNGCEKNKTKNYKWFGIMCQLCAEIYACVRCSASSIFLLSARFCWGSREKCVSCKMYSLGLDIIIMMGIRSAPLMAPNPSWIHQRDMRRQPLSTFQYFPCQAKAHPHHTNNQQQQHGTFVSTPRSSISGHDLMAVYASISRYKKT